MTVPSGVPSKTSLSHRELADALVATAIAAGEAAMAVYRREFAVQSKADASPVTEADQLAEAVILADLARLAPEVPVIAEEGCCAGFIPSVGRRFFLVDPVDGTREFICRNGEFTVNIALIEDGAPVLGIVYAPAKGQLYAGVVGFGAEAARVVDGRVADRHSIAACSSASPPRVVASRSHRNAETDSFIADYPGAEIVPAGSSLKFCLLAAGEADLYPRLSPTMQWDTAAGDAVLRAAGGSVRTLEGAPIAYGPQQGGGLDAYRNPSFVARGGGQSEKTT